MVTQNEIGATSPSGVVYKLHWLTIKYGMKPALINGCGVTFCLGVEKTVDKSSTCID